MRAPQLTAIIVFRVTGIEDTHLTLAAIPFQVGVNNFVGIQKKICRVSVPVIFNSLIIKRK